MHLWSRFLITAVLLGLTSASLGAQVTETPAAFDSAGRVRSLTPALVTRLRLTAPTWPVEGVFREARLFRISTGGQVLAVERMSGTVERYPLSDDALRALQTAVDGAMSESGALVTEAQADVVSEPARGAFIRNQMLLAAMLYAPALSAQTDGGKAAGAVYLIGTGASYFIVTSIANRTTVTRTQNDLATDGAVRGAIFANGLFAGLGPREPYRKVSAAVTLAGALGGTVAGFRRARGLTDSEGKAAKSGSSYSSLTLTGLMGIAGVNDSVSYRATALATVGAGVAGYLLGPRYPRRSAYTVTAGDINMLWIGSTLGVATAFVPLIGGNDIDPRLGWGTFTVGLLGGAFVAERVWVRPYDHTQGDVAQIWLGTLAGSLMGGAIATLAEPDATGALALLTAGGILGAVGAQHLTHPAVARPRGAALPVEDGRRRASLEFSPTALLLAASRTRGDHAVVTFRF